MLRVELLHRRLEHVAFGQSGQTGIGRWRAGVWRRSGGAVLVTRIEGVETAEHARIGHELDAFDHPAAAHLEDLHHRAGRPELQAERVAVAELRARHLLLAGAQRLDRLQRVAQLRGLFEALLGRPLRSSDRAAS